jgi:hypothetical protein
MNEYFNQVTVILPCFNEEKAVGDTLDKLLSHENLKHCEIVVVDDGSSDGTFAILEQYKGRICVVKHRLNRGYGSAIDSGCRASTKDFVVWMDSDGQHRVEDVEQVIQSLVGNDCDYVIGCRNKNSHQVGSRKLGKFVLRQFVQLAIGKTEIDFNSGLRGFKTKVLKKYLSMLVGGFGASTTTTILMQKRRYYGELVPIEVLERTGESSVRQVRDGFRTLLLISRISLIFTPIKIIGSIGLSQLIVGVIYGLFKALVEKQGFPTFGMLIAISGLQTVFLAVVLDQISQLRMAKFDE